MTLKNALCCATVAALLAMPAATLADPSTTPWAASGRAGTRLPGAKPPAPAPAEAINAAGSRPPPSQPEAEAPPPLNPVTTDPVFVTGEPVPNEASPAPLQQQAALSPPRVVSGTAPIGIAPSTAPEAYVDGEPMVEWEGPETAREYDDLWERIRAGFAMREIDSPLVQRHEAWYLNRPEYVERMVDRSRRYLYHIVAEVEKRGMPTEIALLPMIESAYNPAAISHMRAAGMWQFIPSTGRKYGLQQTWWYDGRRDVLAATNAALDYLQELHDMFGDWELALAAYNWGEGAVQRAIDKNRRLGKPTDYMSLKMPKETRNYLPKLQAVKNIVADPELFKLVLAPIPNRPYFAVVNAPANIDVTAAARLAGMPVEEFRSLNPGHQRPVITPGGNHQLLIPADKVDEFNANLQSNEQPLVTWQTYQLKSGERLEQVATKFDISVARLKEVNGLTGHRGVRPGQMLLVPMEDDAETNLDETYASKDFQAPAEDYHKRVIYRAKAGDSVASIAHGYGVSPEDVRSWNGLKGNSVRKGQRLTIWQSGPARAKHSRQKSKGKAVVAARPGGATKQALVSGPASKSKHTKAGHAPKPAGTHHARESKADGATHSANANAEPAAKKRPYQQAAVQ